MKHVYYVTLIILIFAASAGRTQNLMENKIIKYPYYASKERIDQIKNNYKKVKKGMTPQEVKVILGEPDETTPIYEPKIWKPKQIGYKQWYVIQRKCEDCSEKEKNEKLVGVGYDLQWKVIGIDHWGFDEKRIPPLKQSR